MIEKLQTALYDAKRTRDMLQNWLCANTQHAYFLKIAGDRNHLTVKIEALEFKINQLQKGLPILGEPEEFTVVELELLHHKIIN